jgi:hypothetical protein
MNTRAPKYVKQMMMLQAEIGCITIVVGDFNAPLSKKWVI